MCVSVPEMEKNVLKLFHRNAVIYYVFFRNKSYKNQIRQRNYVSNISNYEDAKTGVMEKKMPDKTTTFKYNNKKIK